MAHSVIKDSATVSAMAGRRGEIAYLSETVLGIRSEGIGFRKVRFEPHLSGLNYVKGVCPTPFGPVEAECRRTSDGRTEKHIRLLDGTTLSDSR